MSDLNFENHQRLLASEGDSQYKSLSPGIIAWIVIVIVLSAAFTVYILWVIYKKKSAQKEKPKEENVKAEQQNETQVELNKDFGSAVNNLNKEKKKADKTQDKTPAEVRRNNQDENEAPENQIVKKPKNLKHVPGTMASPQNQKSKSSKRSDRNDVDLEFNNIQKKTSNSSIENRDSVEDEVQLDKQSEATSKYKRNQSSSSDEDSGRNKRANPKGINREGSVKSGASVRFAHGTGSKVQSPISKLQSPTSSIATPKRKVDSQAYDSSNPPSGRSLPKSQRQDDKTPKRQDVLKEVQLGNRNQMNANPKEVVWNVDDKSHQRSGSKNNNQDLRESHTNFVLEIADNDSDFDA